MCRNLVSYLRISRLGKIIPFDKNIEFHKIVGYSIVFFTLVHIGAHYYNFWLLQKLNPNNPGTSWVYLSFISGPGWTGHVMLLALLLMFLTAWERIKRKYFELFWYTHHLFAVYFGLFSVHGMFCLIKPDRPPYCGDGGSFWKYWILSGVLYLTERIIREVRGFQDTTVSKVVLHPSKVVEIQIKKEGIKTQAGQYIFLNCPEVSLHQWHPFTLTSAPEEDYISVHVRVVGNFTTALAKRLGCDIDDKDGDDHVVNNVLPRIQVDGPFGSASEDVFNFEVAVLVGAGIGVTPFASVLKSIWYRVNYPTKQTRLSKVYFFWICRDKEVKILYRLINFYINFNLGI
jgi:NADPH oxidase